MKQSGLGDALFVGGYDLSGDIGSINRVGGGCAVLDVTAINKSAMERIGGVRDGGIEWTSYFNPSVGAAHDIFSALPTTDAAVAYCRGTSLGSPGACLIGKQINYDGTRGQDGAFTFAVQALANGYGLEWGTQVTAGKRSDTTATSPATGVDFTASTSFGWQAYLQVFSFTGTSVTVTLQDSADNSSFAAFTGSAFTAATGVTTQRLASASPTATVRRYVRAITTGTFTQATFNVIFVKNEALSVSF